MSDVKTQVINARLNGYSYGEIAKEFGVAKSTAQGWVVASERDNTPTAYIETNLQRDRPTKFKKTEDEVLDFLAQLAPIKVNYTGEKTPDRSLNDYAVVGSDFHFGCQDQKAIDIFLETVRQLKPKTVVLNGDTMDFLAVSKYPKDIKNNWNLEKERIDYHQFLDNLIGVAGGADIYETVSNHSGQSVGGRWRRYLSERIGELACLTGLADALSYENIFMGDYQKRISHVDYVDLNGLIVTHGETVRSSGGASCLAEVNKWTASIMHGHTHRIGSAARRVPAIAGRPERQLYGYETGCLCSLDATYGTAMNWQQGFAIVSLGQDHGDFGVEQVLVNNGQANIGILGVTLKS